MSTFRRQVPAVQVWLLLNALVLVGARCDGAPVLADPPAAASADRPLVMRFAFLVGSQERPGKQARPGALAPQDLLQYLEDWNFNSDREEVRRVFALNHLTEVSRQATELPANGGKTQGVYTLDRAQYEIHLSVSPLDRDIRIEAELSKNGTLLSAPVILVHLGASAVISTADTEGGRPTRFFVIEVERLPEEGLRDPPKPHL